MILFSSHILWKSRWGYDNVDDITDEWSFHDTIAGGSVGQWGWRIHLTNGDKINLVSGTCECCKAAQRISQPAYWLGSICWEFGILTKTPYTVIKHFNSHLIHDEPHACGLIVHIKILKYLQFRLQRRVFEIHARNLWTANWWQTVTLVRHSFVVLISS